MLYHIYLFQRFILKFNKSTCFPKIIRKTERILQYASSEEIYLTFSNLNTKVEKIYDHIRSGFWFLGVCVLGLGSQFLSSGFWGSKVMSPGVLGLRIPGPEILGPGSRVLGLGSWFLDLGVLGSAFSF